MIQIRPVSDLRNKYSEIENIVATDNAPVFLTKNGYGSMVVMSLQMYEALSGGIENKLDEADTEAENTSVRYSHEEVFSNLKNQIKTKKKHE